MRDYIAELRLIPPTAVHRERQDRAERTRGAVATLLDNETGELTCSWKEAVHRVAEQTGRQFTPAYIHLLASLHRWVARVVVTRQLPIRRPVYVYKSVYDGLDAWLRGDHNGNGRKKRGLNAPVLDPARTAMEARDAVLALVARLEAVEHQLAALTANQPPTHIPEISFSDLRPHTAKPTFAEERHLAHRNVDGWDILYPPGLDRSLKGMPDHIRDLLVTALKRYAVDPRNGLLKLNLMTNSTAQKRWAREHCRMWHLRVTRHWRVLVNRDDEQQQLWIERAIQRASMPGWTEA